MWRRRRQRKRRQERARCGMGSFANGSWIWGFVFELAGQYSEFACGAGWERWGQQDTAGGGVRRGWVEEKALF
jgi:hypothetical protein